MGFARRVTAVSIRMVGDRLYAATPFHDSFIAKARTIGGRWDGSERCWHFPLDQAKALSTLCMECFGTDDGAPAVNREMLERELAEHLEAIVRIQESLVKMEVTP